MAPQLYRFNLARPERLLRASCPWPFGFAARCADSFKIAPGDFVELLSFEFSGISHVEGLLSGARLNLARPERFELPTARFVAEYSIQLSYGREGGALSLPASAFVNSNRCFWALICSLYRDSEERDTPRSPQE